MNSPGATRRTSIGGFISAPLAIILAVLAIGGGLLAYEWRHAHAAKTHHAGAHHHHHHHASGTAAN